MGLAELAVTVLQLGGCPMKQAAAAGASTREVVLQGGVSEAVDLLSSLPARACPSRGVAFLGLTQCPAALPSFEVDEPGPCLVTRRCSHHNRTTRTHCWSPLLSSAHLPRTKLQKAEPLAAAAVVGAAASLPGAAGI